MRSGIYCLQATQLYCWILESVLLCPQLKNNQIMIRQGADKLLLRLRVLVASSEEQRHAR